MVAHVLFCSNHDLGTALPLLRWVAFGVEAPRPGVLPARARRRRAVHAPSATAVGLRDAARARARRPTGRRIFIRARAHLLSPPRARVLELRPRSPSASGAGIPLGSSARLTGRFGLVRSPSERSSGLRLLRARLLLGARVRGRLPRSSGSRPGPSRWCLRRPPLVCSSRPPPTSLPSPSEPARSGPMDCQGVLGSPDRSSQPSSVQRQQRSRNRVGHPRGVIAESPGEGMGRIRRVRFTRLTRSSERFGLKHVVYSDTTGSRTVACAQPVRGRL